LPNPYTLEDVGAVGGGGAIVKGYLAQISRAKDLSNALGILSHGGQPTGGAVLVSQAVLGQAHYLYAGDVVTNIIVAVTTAASGTNPTAIKLGLWNSLSTPVCLGVTASLEADARWTTVGWKVNALTAPITIATSGVYYPCYWSNGAFGSTPLQLALSSNNVAGTAGAIGSAPAAYTALKTSATTMVATDTGTYSAVAAVPLMHIS